VLELLKGDRAAMEKALVVMSLCGLIVGWRIEGGALLATPEPSVALNAGPQS
jgi:hypothetical protein